MTEVTPKAWYESRTIWAGITAIVSGLAGLATVITELVSGEGINGEILGVAITGITSGIGMISGVVAIDGRKKATRPIAKSN